MAVSIFPDVNTAGAKVYRDAAGNPTNPPEVTNAYPPLPAFISTCELTALPNNCDARIEPQQINAIVSELVSFAECLNYTGPWDCNSHKNLCAAFNAWALVNLSGTHIGDTPNAAPKHGQLWWESDTGNLFIWYDDGNSAQWVQIAGMQELPKADGVTIIGTGSPVNPYTVNILDAGVY